MGILEILLLGFIALKIVGVVTWSWLIVFIPLYLMCVIYGAIALAWIIGYIKIYKEINKFMK